ncbi:MAG: hypothetical protein MUE80_01345 [Acidobacteria bacterium]|nr:hypothetical protein [Acidobacteriota bacterium]
MLEVVGHQARGGEDEDDEEKEEEGRIDEEGPEVAGVDPQQGPVALDDGLEVLQPLGDVQAAQGEEGRQEAAGEKEPEGLLAEGQADAGPRDGPPGPAALDEPAVPVGVAFLADDGHHSTPTTPAKRSSSEVRLLTK